MAITSLHGGSIPLHWVVFSFPFSLPLRGVLYDSGYGTTVSSIDLVLVDDPLQVEGGSATNSRLSPFYLESVGVFHALPWGCETPCR